MCRGSARFVSRCRGELSGRSLALLRERPFPKSALKRVWRRKAMRQVQSLPASEACVPPSPIPLLVPFHAHLCCDAGGVSQQKKVQFYTHQVRTSELAEVKLSHVLAANAAPGPSSRSHAKGPEESSGASTLPPGPAQPPFRLQSSPESARKPLAQHSPLSPCVHRAEPLVWPRDSRMCWLQKQVAMAWRGASECSVAGFAPGVLHSKAELRPKHEAQSARRAAATLSRVREGRPQRHVHGQRQYHRQRDRHHPRHHDLAQHFQI